MDRRDFIGSLVLAASGGSLGWVANKHETKTKPGLPQAKFDHVQVKRPQAGDLPFSKDPIAPTYAERRSKFLNWVSERPTRADRGGVLIDLVKFEAGAIKAPSAPALKDALDFVNARRDPADFTVAALVRLYYLHHDDGFLMPEQNSAVRQALLGYKYGLDEPGQSDTEMWTENHQILSHGSDYLMGQFFPDEKFTNDGRTGREHRDKAREQVLRWLNFHARTGPAEWDSIPYYNMDLSALLNLVDFAQDSDVQVRATMMMDLLLFDLAVDSFYGQFGTSHGRAYTANVLSAPDDSLLTFQTLAFGCGRLQSMDMASTILVTSKRYTVPPVLEAIALDKPEEMINLERHSIPLTAEAAEQYGLSLTDIKDFELWWGMGAFTNPEVINLTVDAIEKYNLWHYKPFQPLKTMARFLRPLGLLPAVSRRFKPESNGTLMSEVNKLTYRTPDAMLSLAQDYRPGEAAYQQHIWQATLGPYAVVFVNNPGARDRGDTVAFWASNGRMPRNAQYRNVLISIYNIERYAEPNAMEMRPIAYTHAYFPKWAFDEFAEIPSASGGGWIFGRVADGYVGLYCHLPYQWTTSGPETGQEAGAPGFEHIWVCQIGRKAADGGFRSFVDKVSRAAIDVEKLQAAYDSPGNGLIEFGWDGPMKVNGETIGLSEYPRWGNPYTQTEFGAAQFGIEFRGRKLGLDFQTGSRSQS